MSLSTAIRTFARALLATSAALLAIQAGAQQPFPAHPIRIIVPFTPGGTVDILGRLIAQEIAGPLGQSVIVENKPGAGSALGTEYVARSAPDGYTLLMASTSSMAINPNLQKLSYSLKDFAPVALAASVPHVLVINSDVPATNLKEFIAYARRPGVNLNYATAGTGTPHHLAGALLNQMAQLNMVDVPYKGTGPALADVMGGQVQLMSVDLPPALQFLSSPKVRVLHIAANARSPLAPNVPTVAEAGLPGFEVTGWYGIVAPANTPKDVVDKVAAAIGKALAQPEARAKIAQMGATPESTTPKAFGEFMERESVKWSGVIKKANIKLE